MSRCIFWGEEGPQGSLKVSIVCDVKWYGFRWYLSNRKIQLVSIFHCVKIKIDKIHTLKIYLVMGVAESVLN